MQRWRLEIQSIADELEFPDEVPEDEVQATIEVHLAQMCNEAPAYYWRLSAKPWIRPTPHKFR